MENDLTEDYVIVNDIDCSDTVNWNSNGSTYMGFLPIGNFTDSAYFSGTLNGQNYEISDLYLYKEYGDNSAGLIGESYINPCVIRNVRLVDINMTFGAYGGGLIGVNVCNISNSSTSGYIDIISNVNSETIGGLIGFNGGVNISQSYSEVNIITDGFGDQVGGFVGNNDGNITNCYARGNVSAREHVGGFVGYNQGHINFSYATGIVNSTGEPSGGFAGYNSQSNGIIENSYSTGVVNESVNSAGFVGLNYGITKNCYWNNHTGNPNNATGGGSGTNDVTAVSNNESYYYDISNAPMDAWDFTNFWLNYFNDVYYPILNWQDYLAVRYPTANLLNSTGLNMVFNTSQQGYNDTVWYSWNDGVINTTLCTTAAHCESVDTLPRNESYDIKFWANDTDDDITTWIVSNVTFGIGTTNELPNVTAILSNLSNFSEYGNTSININLTYNITDDNDYVLNSSLFINNKYNYSRIIYPTLDTSINFTKSFPSGTYTWFVRAWDSDLRYNDSDTYTFKINSRPTMTSVELNKTESVIDSDDLNCTAVGIADVDTEQTAFWNYDWYKDDVSQQQNTSQLTAGNTTAAETWYCAAWASDTFLNTSIYTSSSVTLNASGVAPTMKLVNATTEYTGVLSNATNPTANNSFILLALNFSDVNLTNETWTGYFCDTPTWSHCRDNVSGARLCRSDLNYTNKNVTCIYNITGYSGTNPLTFYGFALDNTSLASGSKSSTLEVNYPPTIPTVSYPTNDSYFKVNYSNVTLSSTDPDSDTINYTIYNATNDTLVEYTIENSNHSQSWANLTNLTDGLYYIKGYSYDEHGHSYEANTSSSTFTIDTVTPLMTVTSPLRQTYNTPSVELTLNVTDTNINVCNYSIYYNDASKTLYSGGLTASCNSTVTMTMPSYSSFTIDVWAWDLAGNYNYSSTNISCTASGAPGGPGGSPPQPPPPDVGEIVEQKLAEAPICGNGACQRGESPLNCPSDCPFNVDELLCIFGGKDTPCSAWAFNFIILVVVGGVGYVTIRKQRPDLIQKVKRKFRR